MKGYKVFNPNFTCRGMQYEVGKTYKLDGPLKMCRNGFHFCLQVADCFNYYAFNPSNKVAEIEASGRVETLADKSVTDEITIVREISWEEMLALANIGKGNTGLKNAGNWNSGNHNTGNRNSGVHNSGSYNTGDWNSGNFNSGSVNSGDSNSGNKNGSNCNSGSCNSGNCNGGNRNSGDRNTGNRNSGHHNGGNWNSGTWNSGNYNSGSNNTGDGNTGHHNSGNWNTGDWNSGDWNSGFFSTITPKVDLFEKPTGMTREQIMKIPGIIVLNDRYDNNWWICSEDMTDEEKAEHPEYKTTGGYLKSIPFKDACALMWKDMTADEKRAVIEIPNFDADIFYRITGIDVKNDSMIGEKDEI